MTRRDAEEAAAQLLDRHSLTDVPVPVEQLAVLEGARIIKQRFDGDQSGFIYRDGSNRIIGINSMSSRRRQRFTIAHEIGHMLLHESDPLLVDREVNNRNERSSQGVEPKEIEANAFAAALLMPQELVLRHMREASRRPDVTTRERLITHLAQLFDVSTEAMGYRLINLGIYS